MKTLGSIALVLAVAAAAPAASWAGPFVRQYYDNAYTYSNTYNYYYIRYYYKPTVDVANYDYHYCIYYPSQPRYIYYYNPSTQVYWGRFELGSKGEKRYSILAEKDRKKNLKDISEDAFPAPAAMPVIPGSKDKTTIEPPPQNVPKDAK